jgi:hypothetical protein
MQDEHSSQTNQTYRTIDERLSAYYGPQLSEQPLPSTSWLQLSAQLGSQHHRRRIRFTPSWRRHHFNISDSHIPPAYIQAAYSRIAYDAGFPFVRPMLACSFDMRRFTPGLRVSLLKKRHIRLRLPLAARESMSASALDVLLATGLARSIQMRKPIYWLLRLLIIVVMIVVAATCIAFLALIPHRLPFIKFPIAVGICIVVDYLLAWTMNIQKRRMAFRADDLVVMWLGRNQTCQGLHELADLSRNPKRRTWGDLSMVERIVRVCGTRVPAHDERLTLIR